MLEGAIMTEEEKKLEEALSDVEIKLANLAATGDQAASAAKEMAKVLSAFHEELLREGMPSELSGLLVMQFHQMLLSSGADLDG
jgi:hypothetical protein